MGTAGERCRATWWHGPSQRHGYAYRNLLLPGANDEDLNRLDVTHLYLGTVGYRFGHSARVGFGAAYRERDSTSHWFS